MWKTNGQINEQTYLIKQQEPVVRVISLLQGSPRFPLFWSPFDIKSACSSNSSPNCCCFLPGAFLHPYLRTATGKSIDIQNLFDFSHEVLSSFYLFCKKKECNAIILSGMTINGLKELFVIFQEVMKKSNGFEY